MPPPDSRTREGASLFAADEDNLDALLAEDVLSGVAEPCPLVSQIVEVGFADQATQNALFGGTRKQFVNLTRAEIRQADSDITSDNQIGHTPPIFVRVTPARATTVRLKLTRTLTRGGFPAGSSTLSARERGLAHLQYARSAREYSTDENGELLIEPGLPISALGGGEYRVEAALTGQGFVPGSNAVKVMRRVYLRPVVRYASGRAAALSAMNAIRSTLNRLGIEVKVVQRSSGAELGVVEEPNLADALDDIGRRALRSSTAHVRELRPHSVAVIVGEFINDPIALDAFRVDVARDGSGNFPASVTVTLAKGGSQYVHVPLDDGSSFGSCTVRGGGRTERPTAAAVGGLTAFGRQLTVDLTGVRGNFAAAVATLRVTLNVKAIRGWAVGWAYNAHPVIYLNMRDPNTDAILTAARAEALMVHELGHKLHLTAPGVGGQPDQQAHHYPTFNAANGVSHMGPHCSVGVAAGTDLWTSAAHTAATCTMWGALKTITTFCDECKTTLRKVDLGGGF
jgi:hypothetical protein